MGSTGLPRRWPLTFWMPPSVSSGDPPISVPMPYRCGSPLRVQGLTMERMVRALGILGMAAAFLVISPAFLLTVYGGLESGVKGMDSYAPYSWVGAGVAVLIAAGITLYRGAQAR